MYFELQIIQQQLLLHFGSAKSVPDGDYIVPVYDEDFNVRVRDNAIHLVPDEEFDSSKARRIPNECAANA